MKHMTFAFVLFWAVSASGQSGQVFEQVLVQTIGIPNDAPTGTRFRLVVPSQTTRNGLIAGSQFYDSVCGTYTFQFGYQVQPATGPVATAFADIFPQGTFAVGPALTSAEHEFSVIGRGTLWDFAVDGQVFFTFDAGCALLPAPFHALDAYEQSLTGTNHPVRLRDLRFTQAFSFLVGGVWRDAGPGQGLRDGWSCSTSPCTFDAYGMLQDATVGVNEIVFSRRFPFNPNAFQLW